MRKNKLKRVRPDPGDSIQAREIKIRMSMKCLDLKEFVFHLVWENRVGLVYLCSLPSRKFMNSN